MPNYLAGFGNDKQNGTGFVFKFILSNGKKSTLRDNQTVYDHMIPKDALNKIRSINIYYSHRICGFSFFDKDKKLLWNIGDTW